MANITLYYMDNAELKEGNLIIDNQYGFKEIRFWQIKFIFLDKTTSLVDKCNIDIIYLDSVTCLTWYHMLV